MIYKPFKSAHIKAKSVIANAMSEPTRLSVGIIRTSQN